MKSLVEQATKYATGAAGFAATVEKLAPHLRQVGEWAGTAWDAWAPTLGIG